MLPPSFITHFSSTTNPTGPACITFTPLLSVLYEDAQEEEAAANNNDNNALPPLEIIYVSSDTSATACNAYMTAKHADWLRVPYVERQAYKQRYGVFAGKEQTDFPNVPRRSGIPTLVIVAPDGTAHDILDCDNATVVRDVERQGVAYLERWRNYAWK